VVIKLPVAEFGDHGGIRQGEITSIEDDQNLVTRLRDFAKSRHFADQILERAGAKGDPRCVRVADVWLDIAGGSKANQVDLSLYVLTEAGTTASATPTVQSDKVSTYSQISVDVELRTS
jgi:hypothetical protein